MTKIKYQCKENDNKIKVKKNDENQIDELWFGTSMENEGYVVIGFKDLKAALVENGYDIVKTSRL